MAYVKTTDFAAKDALATGNPSKIVKGTEIDDEFDAIAVADALNVKTTALGTGVETFLGTPTSANLLAAVTNETGTGALVFATSPTLVTPLLGTPTSGVLTNATGLPIATGVSGLGTGVATALAVNVGSAGAPVVLNGALGTPSGGTLTNCTGFPTTGTITTGTPLVQNPYTNSATVTQAHGLGVDPTFFKVELECLTAEGNWSIGDKIKLSASNSLDGNNSTNFGWAVTSDSTNTIFINGVTAMFITNKTTYGFFQITPANWKVTITPYKIN